MMKEKRRTMIEDEKGTKDDEMRWVASFICWNLSADTEDMPVV